LKLWLCQDTAMSWSGSVSRAKATEHLRRSGDAISRLVAGLGVADLAAGDGRIRRLAQIAARHADDHRTDIEAALASRDIRRDLHPVDTGRTFHVVPASNHSPARFSAAEEYDGRRINSVVAACSLRCVCVRAQHGRCPALRYLLCAASESGGQQMDADDKPIRPGLKIFNS
jgi:hypothetical protein